MQTGAKWYNSITCPSSHVSVSKHTKVMPIQNANYATSRMLATEKRGRKQQGINNRKKEKGTKQKKQRKEEEKKRVLYRSERVVSRSRNGRRR